jgi:hypothetical protein
MGHPGKRAPTVELCNDPKGYQPIAIRQHTLGPMPIDPNLIKQGVPVDNRVDSDQRIYAPVEGTPLPPGAVPAGTPPGAPAPAAPVQAPIAPPPPPGNSLNGTPIPPVPPAPEGAAPAAPSAFGGNGSGGPSVAFAPYDPDSGEFVAPDGSLQKTTVASGTPKTWKDLLPT